MIPATEALDKLKSGNARYLADPAMGDLSPAVRQRTAKEGQTPYAIVICCSDSRVIPEAIFCAGIGDLFVIRVAGNVIDDHQLGSIEYAADHLGCRLILVLGHDHCGAVDAALHHDPSGYIKTITDEIRLAVGDETDPDAACRLNALHSVARIEQNLDIARMEQELGLQTAAAIYHIATGEVEFLDR